jgi:hypothetical protein
MLLLLACTPTSLNTPTHTADTAPTDVADTAPTDVADTAGEPVEEIQGSGEDGCPALYAQHLLPDLHLTMSEAQWAGVQADYAAGVQQFRPAEFRYIAPDGSAHTVSDAAVRLRGNPGFSWIGDKMQFMIAFDAYDDDGRFMGLRRLALDASWYNPSLLRDRLAYAYLRRLGVHAPCANHATLTVNGEYYGLYTNVERMDREFLERVYGDDQASGGLWEAGYDLDANADTADTAALSAFWSNAAVAWQEENTDLAGNVLEWAGEAVIPQNDGYWCCSHNYYLYDHPQAGMSFLPWDMDYTFDTAPWFASPSDFYRDNNSQPHLDAVRLDPVWGPRWLEALQQANEAYDPELMQAQVDDWAEQIASAFAADPHTSVSQGAHDDGVARLRAFVAARHGFLTGWIDCEQGEDVDHDGDGYTTCATGTADCDDGDPTIHPGATETCNRRDDDCDLWTDEDAGCDVCDEVAFEEGRFLLCRERMTWAEAEATCVDQGGSLGTPSTTGEWYVIVYSTYWQDEAWAGVSQWWSGGAPCTALTPASWATGGAACDAELPAICRL